MGVAEVPVEVAEVPRSLAQGKKAMISQNKVCEVCTVQVQGACSVCGSLL